jgi:hypothetical protein
MCDRATVEKKIVERVGVFHIRLLKATGGVAQVVEIWELPFFICLLQRLSIAPQIAEFIICDHKIVADSE